jgi:hypothetical protein
MTRIAIESAFEPIEVDFWGVLFETRAMPRSRARKARKLGRHIQELVVAGNAPVPEPIEVGGKTITDPDEIAEHNEEKLIARYGELFDLKLQPAAGGGGRRKPSTVLLKKWEEDKLTGAQLASFLSKLGIAERQQMIDDVEAFAADPVERPT